MGQTVGLDGVKALEVENRLDEAQAGRITVVDCLDIDAKDRAPFRPVVQHFHEGLAQKHGLQIRMIEALADAINDAFLQRPVIDHGRIEERREKRVLLGRRAGFLAQRVPDRIHGRDKLFCADIGSCGHCRLLVCIRGTRRGACAGMPSSRSRLYRIRLQEDQRGENRISLIANIRQRHALAAYSWLSGAVFVESPKPAF